VPKDRRPRSVSMDGNANAAKFKRVTELPDGKRLIEVVPTRVARVPAWWKVEDVAAYVTKSLIVLDEWRERFEASAKKTGGELTSSRLQAALELWNELEAIAPRQAYGVKDPPLDTPEEK
jgi:hypothetical protein